MSLIKTDKGFTLIEVLVAVVIVSVGLLGLASLQIIARQGNYESFQRAQALAIAHAAVDRMKVNVNMLDRYQNDGNPIGASSIAVEPLNCTATDAVAGCETAITDHDLWELEQLLDSADSIISARMCITHQPDASAAGNIRVVIAWRGLAESLIPADELDDCGKTAIDNTFLKQVVVDSYVHVNNT